MRVSKLPPATASRSLAGRPWGPPAGAPRAPVGRLAPAAGASAAGPYRLLVCTANLGASDRGAGHPRLKHCFARLEGAAGENGRTLAFGRRGLGEEPYPEVESVRCEVQARELDAAASDRFVRAFEACGARGYRWGENDCCSCVADAVRRGLDGEPAELITEAAAGIAGSPELL